MIEEVGELHRYRRSHSFGEFHVLGDRRIDVPTVQPSQVTNRATTRIDSQNTAAEICEDRSRVGEYVDLARIVCAYVDRHTIQRDAGSWNASVS